MPRQHTLLDRLSDNRFTKPAKRAIVRCLVANRMTRPLVNSFYRSLGVDGRSKFHGRYASIFNDAAAPSSSGQWTVEFMEARLRLPLRSGHWWLDWNSAVAILGHDIEVKQSYVELIRCEERPDLFLDVGANYGTHSLLFQAAGIPTLSFEPNESCFEYFDEACRLNAYEARWEAVALGDAVGQIDLVFPDRQTWHGSVVTEVIETLKKDRDVRVRRVPLRTLDGYAGELAGKKVLMKIDVEGAEEAALRGAATVLQEVKPTIIFESNSPEKRPSLHSLLARHGYVVEALPWMRGSPARVLSVEAFTASDEVNFLARTRRA